jgi:hypothetical protein
MADEADPQVADAVAQTGVAVVAGAPAEAMAALYQVMAQATGMAAQNAVSNQQMLNQMSPAIVATAIRIIAGK